MLPGPLKQCDCSGRRGVDAAHRAKLGDFHEIVCGRNSFCRKAETFVPEKQHTVLGESASIERCRALNIVESDHGQARRRDSALERIHVGVVHNLEVLVCHQCTMLIPVLISNNVKLVYIPCIESKALSQLTHSLLSTIHACFSKADIVFYVNAANGPFGYLTRLFKKKTVINVDGLEWLRPKWKGWGAKYFYYAAKKATQLFDVVVTDNLFGDILTDIAAAICGGIGLAASGNINPTGAFPSMFEPVHGSAPDIAGKQLADPTATIMSVAMMLDHLGFGAAAREVEAAVAADLLNRGDAKRSTSEIGDALVKALS